MCCRHLLSTTYPGWQQASSKGQSGRTWLIVRLHRSHVHPHPHTSPSTSILVGSKKTQPPTYHLLLVVVKLGKSLVVLWVRSCLTCCVPLFCSPCCCSNCSLWLAGKRLPSFWNQTVQIRYTNQSLLLLPLVAHICPSMPQVGSGACFTLAITRVKRCNSHGRVARLDHCLHRSKRSLIPLQG